MAQAFQVRTEAFEGPLDLLLSLIERRELHVSEFALSAVAESFMDYLRSLKTLPIIEVANFLVVAATLMLIKSSALLPGLALSDEEEESVHDLELRLRVYEKIRAATAVLSGSAAQHMLYFSKGKPEALRVFNPGKDCTLTALYTAVRSLLVSLPQQEVRPSVTLAAVLRIEEVISDLAARVRERMRVSFSDYVRDKKEKVQVIVSFLSLLELVKQGLIAVRQDEHFSEIMLEHSGSTV